MRTRWIKPALTLLLGMAWIGAYTPAAADDSDANQDGCPVCTASAMPASLHFPALPPATCGVLFNIHAMSGDCKLAYPEPGAPCVQDYGCYFSYTVLCQGECGNVVPALFSLGGTALPLWTPCGTDQALGTLPCGYSIEATFLVWDVTSGATAVKTSTLSCSGCWDGDATN